VFAGINNDPQWKYRDEIRHALPLQIWCNTIKR
jgi:hypothetical protein